MTRYDKSFQSSRRPGNNKSAIQRQAASGAYDPDVLEFIMALDAAQRELGRMLHKSEVFQVVLRLGYEKAGKARRKRG